jgi:glycine C-acetyltransferase
MYTFLLLQSRWLILCFVAADKDIIDYLKYNLRSQMFAKANDSNYWFVKTFGVVA